MSDGDDETAADAEETAASDESTDATPETLNERLDDVESALEGAETEADLDDVESDLDGIESDLEAADLPEPDEDDEDAEDPRAELESRVSDLRDDLGSQRGPYASDVVDEIESAQSKVTDTQWTEQGESEIVDVVSAFADAVAGELDADVPLDGDDEDALVAALDDAIAAVEAADLDADEDAETIASLLEATDDLEAGLEDAQEWDDLETNEQLMAQGFYDVLGHYKDYPPELSALKEWEKRGRVDMVLLAKDSLQSEFMQEHCMDALVRMANPEAFEEMHQLAQRRDKAAIKALGRMGDGAAEAVETLVEYVDADSDPALQKVTLRALGEIGSTEATQAIADKLEMDNDNVRPYAARALGLIGDTRAVAPLADTLADDESDTVRAAAAWALRQIGTEEALETVAEYTDERSFLVQHEADLATDALGDGDADAEAPTA
ncbi:HEAT repeat domain-containing protein [Halobellus sp. Atlit-38R]|uniref:HEAT repeat domain-containing protein n=1 Tax=Halobellus sp. Atlit-38R TaxID=2282131 RepID=UPI000EF244AA|nr:HEAT repeat domain-containing protein [Halobellus sp. Atlit-38R]RLM94634.1 HEAT repeat domain-containing protein [Halobellus sp. Atlit-38R]